MKLFQWTIVILVAALVLTMIWAGPGIADEPAAPAP